MMLPIDVPVMISTGMPAFSSTFSTPMCAIPLAPPPLRTMATRFLWMSVLSFWAFVTPHTNMAAISSRIFFIYMSFFVFHFFHQIGELVVLKTP